MIPPALLIAGLAVLAMVGSKEDDDGEAIAAPEGGRKVPN